MLALALLAALQTTPQDRDEVELRTSLWFVSLDGSTFSSVPGITGDRLEFDRDLGFGPLIVIPEIEARASGPDPKRGGRVAIWLSTWGFQISGSDALSAPSAFRGVAFPGGVQAEMDFWQATAGVSEIWRTEGFETELRFGLPYSWSRIEVEDDSARASDKGGTLGFLVGVSTSITFLEALRVGATLDFYGLSLTSSKEFGIDNVSRLCEGYRLEFDARMRFGHWEIEGGLLKVRVRLVDRSKDSSARETFEVATRLQGFTLGAIYRF